MNVSLLFCFREEEEEELADEERAWLPNVYEGGKPARTTLAPEIEAKLSWWQTEADQQASWRVQVISVVTNSSKNSTALEIVQKVYDHVKKGLLEEELAKVNFQILCYVNDDGEVRPYYLFFILFASIATTRRDLRIIEIMYCIMVSFLASTPLL